MGNKDNFIEIEGAKVHNLKNINLKIPREKLVVITGISGSGKSSLAFDTIYSEGQRRYLETFSAYVRQFLGNFERPDVEKIDGLSPVIAIEQKTTSKNPRSTVGTITEIYDFLRLLFSRIGIAYSYISKKKMVSFSEESVIKLIKSDFLDKNLYILSPLVRSRKGHYRELFENLSKQGFSKVRIDGDIVDLSPGLKLDRYKNHDIEILIDRVSISKNKSSERRLKESIQTAFYHGKNTILIVIPDTKTTRYFSRNLMCPTSGISYSIPEPNSFSFNSPKGMCKNCKGLGLEYKVNIEKIIPDRSKSIKNGGIIPLGSESNTWSFSQIKSIAKFYNFDIKIPISEIPSEALNVILYGDNKSFTVESKTLGVKRNYKIEYEGIVNFIQTQYKNNESQKLRRWAFDFMDEIKCEKCNGSRLKKESRNIFINDSPINAITEMRINTSLNFIKKISLKGNRIKIAEKILKEIQDRLTFLNNVGLGYLSLDRSAESLSGGEAQRIRLASQIGSGLVGVTYILDEPSIGLHQRDNNKLIETLKNLRDLGNTVIVVEHDEDAMRQSDHIIDMGPGAGVHGGKVCAQGNLKDILNNKNSITAEYLSKNKEIKAPYKRSKHNNNFIKIRSAFENNLKKINVDIPVGLFTVVTGVSGSGKSTLINQTLLPMSTFLLNRSTLKKEIKCERIEGLEDLDKVINIDQSPIGRTPRSNPATYIGLFSNIRDLFAQTIDSRAKGYKPGRFSFNVKGGRCEACQGDGLIKVEMHFLADVYVTCDICKGSRYNEQTLEIKYKNKSISDVLEMTVEDALDFFDSIPSIKKKLSTLSSVGLNYIKLGQSATTLSGGEAQRIKLSKELSKRSTGKTLFILDEPTTGLHFADIQMLLNVLFELKKQGNTIVVIEHNLDVIKTADWIIDLGPEGGIDGGELVVAGTPEDVSKHKGSFTGKFLKPMLK